jgi:hypothetical protein
MKRAQIRLEKQEKLIVEEKEIAQDRTTFRNSNMPKIKFKKYTQKTYFNLLLKISITVKR